jgi:hypothetical protein
MTAPSNNPVKWEVLNTIKTNLAAITVANDFHTNVRKVHLIDGGPLNLAAFPCIVVAPGFTEYTSGAGRVTGVLEGKMSVDMGIYVKTRTNAVQTVEKFTRDVITKMLSDVTLGGISFNVVPERDEIYLPSDASDPICGAELTFSIYYRTLRTDLNSAQT